MEWLILFVNALITPLLGNVIRLNNLSPSKTSAGVWPHWTFYPLRTRSITPALSLKHRGHHSLPTMADFDSSYWDQGCRYPTQSTSDSVEWPILFINRRIILFTSPNMTQQKLIFTKSWIIYINWKISTKGISLIF